jgi:hypothetical protein
MSDLDGTQKTNEAATPDASRRATRARRALDREAIRSEFELDRPRRMATLRGFIASLGELERARLRALEAAARLSPAPADDTDDRPRAKSR